MNTVQATIYGAKLNLALLLGRTPVIEAKSTMNERLEILPNARPADGEKVYLGVMTVGIGGHRGSIGADGIPLISIIDHYANHGSTYKPRPFAMKRLNEDFTKSEREQWCLRKEEPHDGEIYACYYGYRLTIDVDDVPITMQWRIVEDGVTRIVPFVPDSSDLYPPQVALPVEGAVTTTDISLQTSAVVTVTLNENIIAEYVNVAKILNNGDERYAVMSEFTLNTGADRKTTIQTQAGPVEFLESIGNQVYAFSADHKALYYNSQELKIDFDIGNQVPMLATQSIPTVTTIGTNTASKETPITSNLG
jgi:hypothetical protein